MKATLTTSAHPNGSYQITSAFTDEDGDAVTPETGLTWTLKDDKGDVVNSRTAVAMTEAASIETWLTGADLASQGVEDNGLRVFSLDGQIITDGPTTVDIDSAVIFPIDVLLPVSLRQTKEHLRIPPDNTDNDISLCYLITAARRWVESQLGRKLMTQTVTYYFDRWPDSNMLVLPYGSMTSVATIKYKDSAGVQTTWDSAEYIDDVGNEGERSKVTLAYGFSWPSFTPYPFKPIEVIYDCGYGDDTGDVPEPIKQAIKIKVADLYENRESDVMGISKSDFMKTHVNTIDALLGDYKIYEFNNESW